MNGVASGIGSRSFWPRYRRYGPAKSVVVAFLCLMALGAGEVLPEAVPQWGIGVSVSATGGAGSGYGGVPESLMLARGAASDWTPPPPARARRVVFIPADAGMDPDLARRIRVQFESAFLDRNFRVFDERETRRVTDEITQLSGGGDEVLLGIARRFGADLVLIYRASGSSSRSDVGNRYTVDLTVKAFEASTGRLYSSRTAREERSVIPGSKADRQGVRGAADKAVNGLSEQVIDDIVNREVKHEYALVFLNFSEPDMDIILRALRNTDLHDYRQKAFETGRMELELLRSIDPLWLRQEVRGAVRAEGVKLSTRQCGAGRCVFVAE